MISFERPRANICLLSLDHPGMAYYAGILGTPVHDWQWQSVGQTNANNRVMNWPGGKLLGGSSAANGCYLVRPSSVEVDAWHGLISAMDGADNWTSEKFFAAMDKVCSMFSFTIIINS